MFSPTSLAYTVLFQPTAPAKYKSKPQTYILTASNLDSEITNKMSQSGSSGKGYDVTSSGSNSQVL